MEASIRVRTHLSDPKDDDGCDADGGHEGMSASVVASVDAPPIFELSEHVFDLVPLAIESARSCSIGFLRFDLDRMHTVMPRAARAWLNQPAS